MEVPLYSLRSSHGYGYRQPLEKGKARIRFDDGTEVVLYKGEIRKLGIEEGCVVTEAVYDKILNEILGKRAIKRAMHPSLLQYHLTGIFL